MTDQGDAAGKSFVCGVCKQTFPGVPKGGVNTVHGEVIVCTSTKCFASALEHAVPAQDMWKAQANKGQPD